jgi:large subunit ribosomal protein L34e
MSLLIVFYSVKTPGNKLVAQYITKRGSIPKCGDCQLPLQGLKAQRTLTLKWAKKRERRVSRAYGGSQCAQCVRQRILRAFLIEEQKIVKDVLKQRESETKKPAKKTTKKAPAKGAKKAPAKKTKA